MRCDHNRPNDRPISDTCINYIDQLINELYSKIESLETKLENIAAKGYDDSELVAEIDQLKKLKADIQVLDRSFYTKTQSDSRFITHKELMGYAQTSAHYTKRESDERYIDKYEILNYVPRCCYESDQEEIKASIDEINTELSKLIELLDPTSEFLDILDHLDYEDTEIDNQYVSAVKQENGKISVTRKNLPVYEEVGVAESLVDALAEGQVLDNSEAIAILNSDVDTEGSVKKTVADAISDANLDQYAKVEDLGEIASLDIIPVSMIQDFEDEVTQVKVNSADIADKAICDEQGRNIHDTYAEKATTFTKDEVLNQDVAVLAEAQEYADSLGSNYDKSGAADAVKDALIDIINNKVDKEDGKSLIETAEIDRLAKMSNEANKVEASEENGNIKIDGDDVTVYTHPDKHVISEVDGLQDAIDSLQPKGNYAEKATTLAGYGITDAYTKDEVSNQDAVVLAEAQQYADTQDAATKDALIKLIEEKQPAGNYAPAQHKHSVEDISEFKKNVIETIVNEAVKSTKDGDGNVISETYAKKATTLESYGISDAYTKIETSNQDALVLAEAQSYTDAAVDTAKGLVNELAEGQVKTNTKAIAAINDSEEGILKQAKDYTDELLMDYATKEETANQDAVVLGEAENYADKQIEAAINELDLPNTYEAKGAAARVSQDITALINTIYAVDDTGNTSGILAQLIAEDTNKSIRAIAEDVNTYLKSVELCVVETAKEPYSDAIPGNRYIKFTISNNLEADDSESYLYLELPAITEDDLPEDTVEKINHATQKHAPIDAEKNKIDIIKVNGNDVDIENKTVSLTIPSGALANKDQISSSDLDDTLKEKINAAAEGNHSHSNKTELDKITEGDVDNFKAAYTHSQTAHASVDAQANIIESVKVNGTALEIKEKAVDITVPIGALAGKDEVIKSDLAEALATEIDNKVEKIDGKSLVADTEITKLASVSEGANKVEKSKTNGNIKVNDEEVVVYTHPDKHAIGDVTGLQDALDGLQAKGDYATKTELGDVDKKFADYRTSADQDIIDNSHKERIETLEAKFIGDNSVDAKIAAAVKTEEDARKEAVKGVQDAVDAITKTHSDDKAELTKDVDSKIASITAADASITIAGPITAPTIAAKLSQDADNALTLVDDGLKVVIPTAAEYTIVKAADSGDYAAIYNLTKDGVIVGASINIPKDLVVKSGSVVDDKIILVLNDEANTEINIPVESLIEYVTSGSVTGDMIVINISDDHKVTASITDGTITPAKLDIDTQTKIKKAHSHENAGVLDALTAEKIDAWDAAEQNAKKYAQDTFAEKEHSHEPADITDFNSAVKSIEVNAAIKASKDALGNIIHETYAEKSSTLSGYGIEDAYTKDEVDDIKSDILNSTKEYTDDVVAEINSDIETLSNIVDISEPLSEYKETILGEAHDTANRLISNAIAESEAQGDVALFTHFVSNYNFNDNNLELVDIVQSKTSNIVIMAVNDSTGSDVQSNQVIVSRDRGLTWTSITLPSTCRWKGIHYVPATDKTSDTFTLYGHDLENDQSCILTSYDGINWEAVYVPELIIDLCRIWTWSDADDCVDHICYITDIGYFKIIFASDMSVEYTSADNPDDIKYQYLAGASGNAGEGEVLAVSGDREYIYMTISDIGINVDFVQQDILNSDSISVIYDAAYIEGIGLIILGQYQDYNYAEEYLNIPVLAVVKGYPYYHNLNTQGTHYKRISQYGDKAILTGAITEQEIKLNQVSIFDGVHIRDNYNIVDTDVSVSNGILITAEGNVFASDFEWINILEYRLALAEEQANRKMYQHNICISYSSYVQKLLDQCPPGDGRLSISMTIFNDDPDPYTVNHNPRAVADSEKKYERKVMSKTNAWNLYRLFRALQDSKNKSIHTPVAASGTLIYLFEHATTKARTLMRGIVSNIDANYSNFTTDTFGWLRTLCISGTTVADVTAGEDYLVNSIDGLHIYINCGYADWETDRETEISTAFYSNYNDFLAGDYDKVKYDSEGKAQYVYNECYCQDRFTCVDNVKEV